MTAFDHVLLLLSFVYALALTHLLSRTAALLVAGSRVRLSGLLILAMVNAAILVFGNWLVLWDAHGISTWGLYSIVMQFLLAVGQFFLCATAAPDIAAEGFYRPGGVLSACATALLRPAGADVPCRHRGQLRHDEGQPFPVRAGKSAHAAGLSALCVGADGARKLGAVGQRRDFAGFELRLPDPF
ncbi:MAG: hypothetical protein JO256_11115 [Alphaproteobacteria bacterium]|nr:hypothetical protein [Alphaproteobacteria bacterium]